MKAQSLFEKIYNTLEQEILCSECLDQVSRYVDIELDGQPFDALLPQVTQHIQQCKVCHEEYELLHELARLERSKRLPSLESLRNCIQTGSSGD